MIRPVELRESKIRNPNQYTEYVFNEFHWTMFNEQFNLNSAELNNVKKFLIEIFFCGWSFTWANDNVHWPL